MSMLFSPPKYYRELGSAPIRLQIAPQRILLVEPDPISQAAIKRSLKSYPQLTLIGQVTDGTLGVETALRLKPDLLIVNADLPCLQVPEPLKPLRTALPSTRILLVTGHKITYSAIAPFLGSADAYCVQNNCARNNCVQNNCVQNDSTRTISTINNTTTDTSTIISRTANHSKTNNMVQNSTCKNLVMAIACIQDGAIYFDPEIATNLFRHIQPTVPPPPNHRLSERELEVLQLVIEGRSNPEIAATLYLSLSTVKAHLRNIMSKLAVDDRVQAAVTALRSGLIRNPC